MKRQAMHTTTLALLVGPSNTLAPLSLMKQKRVHSLRASEWKSDFDDFVNDGESSLFFNEAQVTTPTDAFDDLSGCKSRQFSLGLDLVLSDFAGSMGFDEVTDWEYDREDDDGRERQVVQPNPLDPAQPRRTRSSSGSVVRVFRGEFIGRLGSTMRSQGLDSRILVKEYSGKLALDLARAELTSIGKLQSDLASNTSNNVKDGEWLKIARSRSVNGRKDDLNLCSMSKALLKAPFLGTLGEVNLAELEDELDPNEFYRALGVQPPKPGAIWIVYEYAGLTSLATFCQPAEIRRSKLPPKRGFLGAILPDPIPSWAERSRYVRAIMKQSLEAVAFIHDSGISHRSIGRSSLIMCGFGQDKTQASSVYAVNPSFLLMKVGDFGFSGLMELATYDSGVRQRARTFGIAIQEGKMTEDVKAFCQAEDLHALGLVLVALLLTALAEVEGPRANLPATDDDTLQRLMSDIFEKDIMQFREYVEAEEMWENVVGMLDTLGGWELLSSLCFAREAVKDGNVSTARRLLSSAFFTTAAR